MIVIPAQAIHVPLMSELSSLKRKAYEKVQPQFWSYAGISGDQAQIKWFKEILSSPDYIALVAMDQKVIEGFVIGQIISAPSVYNPGGLTILIDDFCVADNQWDITGQCLLDNIKHKASTKNISQIVVVSGAHDVSKKQFLEKNKLSTASEWYVGSL